MAEGEPQGVEHPKLVIFDYPPEKVK